MGGGETLAELRERRTAECRLDPALALRSVDEAAAFLAGRGMLTRTADCSLPSLFEACHQRPYRAGRGGFAEWPETAYPWFWELARRDGVCELSVHGGKRILLTSATATLADPICRAELAMAEAGGGDHARLLGHLLAAGPSAVDDIKLELEWDAARLRRVRRPLERSGALVSHGVTFDTGDGGHLHSSVLARWDQAFLEPSEGSLGDVMVAGVRAAVLAPEPELARWFSWSPRPDRALIDGLVEEGRLYRPAPGWLAAAV
jgi:hypothetical protein